MTAVSVAAQSNNNNNNNVSKNVLAVQTLYNYLVYPNSQQVFPASGVSPVDALFSPLGVQGRIAPFGEGHDLTTVKKYFFGVINNLGLSTYFSLTGVTFRSITDSSPLVIVEVDLSFTPTANAPAYIQPFQLRETGQFTFNKAFQIVSFDLLMPYYDTAMASSLGVDLSDPNAGNALRQSICFVAVNQQSCTGNNAVFSSFQSCLASLSSIPVGSFNRVSANSIACRAFHEQYLSTDPLNECPNVGATGGTQCVDTPLSTYFTETF